MAVGLLLLVLGVWLLLQTLAGNLPKRILSWGKSSGGDASTPGDRGESGLGEHGEAGGGTSGGGGGSW